jgi:hypothetical protein
MLSHEIHDKPRGVGIRLALLVLLGVGLLMLAGRAFSQSGSLINPTVAHRPGVVAKGGTPAELDCQVNPTRPTRPVP